MNNWDCSGSGPHTKGPVYAMPTGGDGNMILCHACWNHELEYRKERNADLAEFAKFSLPEWPGGPEKYQRKFSLGYGKYDGNLCPVDIEIKLTDGRLSVVGHVWMPSRRDIYTGGQCYEAIGELFPERESVRRLIEIWRRWHLNDMNPCCEHQQADGWREISKKNVSLYNWELSGKIISERSKIKEACEKVLLSGASVQLSGKELKIMNLEFWIKTTDQNLPKNLAAYYTPSGSRSRPHVEAKMLGWLNQNEHPEGILSKPCPVCGYEYGTAWKTEPIPPEVIAEILSWNDDYFKN